MLVNERLNSQTLFAENVRFQIQLFAVVRLFDCLGLNMFNETKILQFYKKNLCTTSQSVWSHINRGDSRSVVSIFFNSWLCLGVKYFHNHLLIPFGGYVVHMIVKFIKYRHSVKSQPFRSHTSVMNVKENIVQLQ